MAPTRPSRPAFQIWTSLKYSEMLFVFNCQSVFSPPSLDLIFLSCDNTHNIFLRSAKDQQHSQSRSLCFFRSNLCPHLSHSPTPWSSSSLSSTSPGSSSPSPFLSTTEHHNHHQHHRQQHRLFNFTPLICIK